MNNAGEFDVYTWGQRVRGLLIGLAIGDAIGAARGKLPETGPVQAGVATQLAAFTTEGIIRATVRANHKGISSLSGVVWHAYSRWAAGHGIEVEQLRRRWQPGTEGAWPDGWLAQVPLLTQRRGSAPATVSAVRGLEPGTPERPVSNSAGAHALTRTLPVAALGRTWSRKPLVRYAEEIAALSHGHEDAHWSTSTAVLWAAGCLVTGDLVEALGETNRMEMGTYIGYARDTALDEPRQQAFLARDNVAADRTARSALTGAVYATHSFPDPGDAVAAVEFAATAPGGSAVPTVTAAILGATHGVDVWPVELVSRLELAWVMDTLARDLVLQLTDNPGGEEYTKPRDPHWWDRYPGW